jgi:hypothetical protein
MSHGGQTASDLMTLTAFEQLDLCGFKPEQWLGYKASKQ